MPDSSDDGFVSAGYYLTRPVALDWLDPARFPRPTLVLNEDHASVLPASCFLDGQDPGRRDDRRRAVLDFFSIPASETDEMRRWTASAASLGAGDPDGGSVSLRFVQDLARRFLSPEADAVVVGLAAPLTHVDEIARCFGEENLSPYVPLWLTRRTRPEPEGRVLGFESAPILRECPQRACSWICEGLDWDRVEREIDVRLDAHGLLPNLADAERACAWLRRQPGLCGGDRWFPWRLASYEWSRPEWRRPEVGDASSA